MEAAVFSRLRAAAGLSRKELAAMLGASAKAVESYEQGWRRVPPPVERMVYYVVFKLRGGAAARPCWEARSCAEADKAACPAFRARDGAYCWFLTGRLCAAARAAADPDSYCFGCPVFAGLRDSAMHDEEARPCP